jgi:hypothetical protein
MFNQIIFKNTKREEDVSKWNAVFFENLFIWGELDDWSNAEKQLKALKLSTEYKNNIKFAIKTTEQQGLPVPYYFKELTKT